MRSYGEMMRIVLISTFTVFLCSQVSFAETSVIYRKSDKLVVGYATPPQTVEAEIINMINSELGGSTDDYASTVINSIPDGHEVVVASDGTASTKERKKVKDARQAKLSAITKLKGLGLTDKEVAALFGE